MGSTTDGAIAFVPAIAAELAASYATLRRATALQLQGDTEEQNDVLALLAGDLEAFCLSDSALMQADHWSPAYSNSRLVNERAEYLLAVHEDVGFASRFWQRSAEITDESQQAPRNRSGEARTFVRRMAERRAGADTSEHLPRTLILRHDWESVAVHPSAVTAALACNARDGDTGAALTIAQSVATALSFALSRS